MAMKMFKRNPDGVASVGDRIRGCIALACCIGGFVGGYHAENVQWQAFFMIVGFLCMITAIGIIFKEADY